MAPTTIREPSYDLPEHVSPPHTVCVRLSFYWSFFFFLFSPLLPYLLRIGEQYKGEGWNWNRGNVGIISLSALCSERKIEKREFGHFVEGGAGMTLPYLFVIILISFLGPVYL